MTLQEIMEERKKGHIAGALIGGFSGVITAKLIEETEKEFYNGSEEKGKRPAHEDYEGATREAVKALEEAPVLSPRIDTHRAVYELRELYRKKAVGDLKGEDLTEKLEGLKPEDKVGGISAEEEKHVYLHQSFVQKHNIGISTKFRSNIDSECLLYWFIYKIERKDNEDSSQEFEKFLRQYCVENKGQINGRHPSVRDLVRDYEDKKDVNFSAEPKTLDFVLYAGKRDLMLHIMLIKYYEAVNNRAALLEVCDSAVKNFNEPWFAYKFAEHVKNNDGNYFDTSLEKLVKIKKTGADKDKYRMHINVGDFFLRTGVCIEDLQEAKKAYEDALLIKPESVLYSELSAKISEIENCINAAKEIEKVLYPKPEKRWLTGQLKPPKKLSIERRASMWEESLMGNYSLLKGYLKRHNDQHPYTEQIKENMGRFASRLLKDIEEGMKEDEVEKRALKKMIYHLRERCKQDKSKKESYEARIINYQKNIYEIEHNLVPYKRKYEKIVDSVLQIFPELDIPNAK
jgi:hypothetical protein